MVLVIYYSFTRWTGFDTPDFIGLQNYRSLGQHAFANALRVTLVFALVGAVASVALGTILAAIIQERLKGWRFYRVVWFAPTIIPGAVVAIIWANGVFAPSTGAADAIERALGLGVPEQGWLATNGLALLALIITAVWAISGLPMLLISAAMERIPKEYEEAAKLDGASARQRVTLVTLPLIRPVLATVLGLQIIGLLKAFDLIYIMTLGGPGDSTTTISYLMYNAAFVQGNAGLASSYALILMIVVMPIALLARNWVTRDD